MLSTIPHSIQDALVVHLESTGYHNVELHSFSLSSGGCINVGGRLATSCGLFFIKWNDRSSYPTMFDTEQRGLKMLGATKTVRVPEVMFVGETKEWQFLVMEFINTGSHSKFYWEELGRQLAMLHKNNSSYFGLDHDNYIGSLPQPNRIRPSWVDFFVEQRLQPMTERLINQNSTNAATLKPIEKIYAKLGDLLPAELPSLLHGDLWSGNVIPGSSGQPIVVDPAIYYGHREAELAFTKLFGGFEESFYKSYKNHFPLTPGFENRYELYNLYPLLVHANLFGSSYLLAANRIINRFL